MRFSKFYLFAIGTAGLTYMFINEAGAVNKTTILCPNAKDINCQACPSPNVLTCYGKTKAWYTLHCSKSFEKSPSSFKLDVAVDGAFPHCRYNAYYKPDQQGSWETIELYNRKIISDCTANRSKNGFECPTPLP
jgi:hypothetical protein